MCGKLLPEAEVQVIANDATWRWVPLTRWLGAGEINAASALLLVRDRLGNLNVRFAYQPAATDRETPGAVAGYPKTFANSGCDIVDRGDLSVLMSSNAWARLGTALVDTAGTRVFTGFQDLTTPAQNTKNNFWIRFGLDLQRATGSAPERAIVRFTGYTRY